MRTFLAITFLSIFSILSTSLANAEPPANVPRLSFLSGTVSFSPAGVSDWVLAKLNRPMVNGDKLWADTGGRAEIQFIDSAFRLAEKTNANLLNFDDNTAQLQLPTGSVCVHVGSVKSNQAYEVDTPNLAFSIIDPGDYRIDVSADGKTTTVQVKSGKAQVSGKGNSYNLDANQAYRFSSNDLSGKESTSLTSDDFDSFCSDRNKELPTPQSSPNVSNQVPGTSDLNNSDNGSWTTDDNNEKVWQPNRPKGWSPYRDGTWTWIEPWGWTWVSNEPWGFAPYYYGRWRFIDRWFWTPIPYNGIPFFAPGLVRFLRGINIIGFYPLGPRELYIPTFIVNINLLARINNLTPNDRVIIDYWNNPNQPLRPGVNQNVPGAVIGVPQGQFGQPGATQTPMTPEEIKKAQAGQGPGTVPTKDSVTAGMKPSGSHPPSEVDNRTTIAIHTPPPAPVPFDQKQACLAKHPGQPCTPEEIAALNPQVPTTVIIVEITPPKDVHAAPQPPAAVSTVPVTEPIRHARPQAPPPVKKVVPSKPRPKAKPPVYPKKKVYPRRKPHYPRYPRYPHYPQYPRYPQPQYPQYPVPQYTPQCGGPHINVYTPSCGGGGGGHC